MKQGPTLRDIARRIGVTRRLTCFDLETTSKDAMTARIVEIALVSYDPKIIDVDLEYRALIHPGIPIPAEATAVHGISNADVIGKPSFKMVADEIAPWFHEADVIGYNLRKYDVPLLDAEFKRNGKSSPFVTDMRIIDSFSLYQKREGGSLGAAVRFYCGREHVGAHGALADMRATVDVLAGQIDRYEITSFAQLMKELAPPAHAIDHDCKLIWKDGEACIGFGKHEGRPLKKVPTDYLRWMLGNDFSPHVKDVIEAVLHGKYPQPPTLL